MYLRKEYSKFFPAGPFFSVFQIKCLSKCPCLKKPPLPSKIPGYAPANVRSVQFGLCCISIFFLSFFLLLFLFSFFYWYFPWQTLTIHRIARMGEGIIVFLVVYFHSLTNIHLVHRDFYHFFLVNVFVIKRLIDDETSSP